MADGNVKQATPAAVRQQPDPDSPYYTRANMPDGCSPGARWLFSKGWQCLGDPNCESSQWRAPDAVDEEKQRLEPKKGYVRRVTGREKNGDPIVERVEEHLMEQDGSNPHNMGQPTNKIHQLVITPPTPLVGFRQAVEKQQANERQLRNLVGRAS